MITISRIDKNHKLLNNKINLDGIMRNHNGNLENVVLESCQAIYKIEGIEQDMKNLLMLENIATSAYNCIGIKETSDIIATVTDFLTINEFSSIEEIETILEKSKVKEKANKKKLKDKLDLKKDDNTLTKLKNKSDARSFIGKFYANSKKNITNETPNMFAILRKTILYSATGCLGVPAFAIGVFVDKFIEMKFKRAETKKMIEKLENEIKAAEKSGKKLKTDVQKEENEKYIKELEDSIDDLKYYEQSLYTDKEIEEKEAEEDDLDIEESVKPSIDTVYMLYKDNFHSKHVDEVNKLLKEASIYINSTSLKSLKECTTLNTSDMIVFENTDNLERFFDVTDRVRYELCEVETTDETIMENVKNLYTRLNNVKSKDLSIELEATSSSCKIISTLIKPFSGCGKDLPHISLFREYSYVYALEDIINGINQMEDENDTDLYSDIDIDNIEDFTDIVANEYTKVDINKLKYVYRNMKNDYYAANEGVNKYKVGTMIESCIGKLNNYENKPHFTSETKLGILREYVEYYHTLQSIQEVSLGSGLKLAQKNIANKAKKMSDKEKAASATIDNGLESIVNKIEKDLTNSNREKVIKGSLIPKASTIIKVGLASNIAFFVSPILAVVGVLGGVAVSKNATEKERQYILDEIEVQTKVVEKKIQMAENNNDMKALEELLKIDQRLKRETKRIKYKLKSRRY